MQLEKATKNKAAKEKNTPALSLTFKCIVQRGEGRFSRMVFPGRRQIKGTPPDWPKQSLFNKLAPGSLNCRVIEFPDHFDTVAGDGDRIAKLDSGNFEPAFTIPHDRIENNGLHPVPGNLRRGLAQVWRCHVTNEDTGESFSAWHVRRVDGSYPKFHDIIELMADRKLRDAYNLQDGTPLTIRMQRGNQPQ